MRRPRPPLFGSQVVATVPGGGGRYCSSVDWMYWIDKLTSLGLLIAGGGLTILGAWLNNREQKRTRMEEREVAAAQTRDARNREALAALRDTVFMLYVDVRNQSSEGNDRASIDQATLLRAESQAYLLVNEQLRESVDLALRALRGLSVPINHGYLDGSQITIQAQTLHAILRLLAAEDRGADLPEAQLQLITKVGESTRDAWADDNAWRKKVTERDDS